MQRSRASLRDGTGRGERGGSGRSCGKAGAGQPREEGEGSLGRQPGAGEPGQALVGLTVQLRVGSVCCEGWKVGRVVLGVYGRTKSSSSRVCV